MPYTKEEKAAHNKKYRENNKEKIAKQKKEHRENNKERLREQAREHRENNKEKISAKKKEHYELNKEHLREQAREHYQENREHILELKAENCIANRERSAEYAKTPNGIRSRIISGWKSRGVSPPIGMTLHELYDNIYLPCTHCMVCKNEFKSRFDKQCDHNHDLVENNFRYVLCRCCNTRDSWKNKI